MSFHTFWLFTWYGVFLVLSKLRAKSIILSVDSSLISPLLSRFHEFDDLLGIHLEELVKLMTLPHLLSEGLLLWYYF